MRWFNRSCPLLAIVGAGACYGGPDEAGATEATSSSSTGVPDSSVGLPTATADMTSATTASTTPTSATTTPGSTTTTAGSATTDSADTTAANESADTTGAPATDCDFTESFDLPDGSAWPGVWSELGGVEIADVQGGRGRLVPTPGAYAVARMGTSIDCADIEVTFTLEMSQPSLQGVGLYVRQNGGYLQHTDPHGQGYVGFIQGFQQPAGIGAWHELDGVEQLIGANVAAPISANVPYRVRLRVTQQDAGTTLIQARIWAASAMEPAAWQLERTDGSAALQGESGALAIDTYTVQMPGVGGDMFIDDIVATAAR